MVSRAHGTSGNSLQNDQERAEIGELALAVNSCYGPDLGEPNFPIGQIIAQLAAGTELTNLPVLVYGLVRTRMLLGPVLRDYLTTLMPESWPPPFDRIIYAALVDDRSGNELITADLLRSLEAGRSPLLLTARTDHLRYFSEKLASVVKNLFVLKGGMSKKQRQSTADALATVPLAEPRVILATGSYIGEGFDDARLDTLFLAMPISWKGTLQQYVGRLHRLHDNKHVVLVYDYVDSYVPMLARMYERRLKRYAAIGYIVQPREHTF
jgi:hypothetical protein